MKSFLKLKSKILLGSAVVCLLNSFSICSMAVGPESTDDEVNNRIEEIMKEKKESSTVAMIAEEISHFLPERDKQKFLDAIFKYTLPGKEGAKLNIWVNEHMPANSRDTNTVRIYAILYGYPVEEMKKLLQEQGL